MMNVINRLLEVKQELEQLDRKQGPRRPTWTTEKPKSD